MQQLFLYCKLQSEIHTERYYAQNFDKYSLGAGTSYRISVVLISKFLGACEDCVLESFYIFQMIQSFEVAYQEMCR